MSSITFLVAASALALVLAYPATPTLVVRTSLDACEGCAATIDFAPGASGTFATNLTLPDGSQAVVMVQYTQGTEDETNDAVCEAVLGDCYTAVSCNAVVDGVYSSALKAEESTDYGVTWTPLGAGAHILRTETHQCDTTKVRSIRFRDAAGNLAKHPNGNPFSILIMVSCGPYCAWNV